MGIRTLALIAALALTASATAQTPTTYVESRSTAPAPGTYFYAFFRRDDPRVSAIIAFEPEHRLDGASALWITRTIDCETGRITTVYQAYGDDGALLRERQSVPPEVSALVGSDTWSTRLNTRCDPPAPQPIPVAIDPPPMPDRDFTGRIRSAPEAIGLMRARTEARAQAAALANEGRWGTFTGRRLTGAAYIDYTASDATHMSYLATAPSYEGEWNYARARYTIDCAAQTAFVEYYARYDGNGAVLSVEGPSRNLPTAHMQAREAITAHCESAQPRGRTYTSLPEALRQLRAEADRR